MAVINFPMSYNINFQEFFDFLSCAFKVNLEIHEKGCFDTFSNNEFVNKILCTFTEKCKVDSETKSEINGTLQESEFAKIDSHPIIVSTQKNEQDLQGIRSLFIRINRKTNDSKCSAFNLTISESEIILKDKLEEIIGEGILDSLFPFLISRVDAILQPKKTVDVLKISNDTHSKSNKILRKHRIRKHSDSDAEIEIQVCDEINNISKRFKCPQSLLLSKMEYFAEVTEGQRLEDMDISVHCDVAIFEWLMKWVRKPTKDITPFLNEKNVTPILISAMFLRMNPLVDECAMFFKTRMKEIVDSNASFSCLNDNTLDRIAGMLNNLELDTLDDPMDKIQSKLFCKFILSLGRRDPEKEKGHYSSLSSVYRCTYCKKILHEDIDHSIPCIYEHLTIDSYGNIQGRHLEDSSWNLNMYIRQLKREENCWRNVYWKLWGTCHYVKCFKCGFHYQLCYSLSCRYHPNGAHFRARLNSNNQNSPTGHFVCCARKCYKFDILGLPTGCLYRPHIPSETEKSYKIIFIMQKKKEAICFLPNEKGFPQELCMLPLQKKESCSGLFNCYDHWTYGKYLHKLYSFNELLGAFEDKESEKDTETREENSKMFKNALDEIENISSESEYIEMTSIGDGEDSDGSCSSNQCYTSQPPSTVCTKYWTSQRSIRSNQDTQREKEEKMMRYFVGKLSRNWNDNDFEIFIANNIINKSSVADGGVYATLEDELKEEIPTCDVNNFVSSAAAKSPNPRSGRFSYL